MKWLKKYWQEWQFRMITYFCLGGGLISIPVMTWIDYTGWQSPYSTYDGIELAGFIFGWGIYFVILFPIFYFKRKD